MDGVLGLRIMYGAATLGAGAVGALTLFSPQFAGRTVFFGDVSIDPYFRILGSLWLALGAVACLGLLQPTNFLPLLLIQFVYKTAWLAVVAYPLILVGNREAGLLMLTALFTIWAVALGVTIPFSRLFDLG